MQSLPQETTLRAQNAQTRARLRSQARLEFENNPHAAGIARLFGLYVVGVGPRLRFKGFCKHLKRPIDKELEQYVEFRWERFADEIELAVLLRQAMESVVVDGEAFVAVVPNPAISVGVDAVLIDSQRVGNPNGRPSSRREQDGVELDEFGNVRRYCVYDVPNLEHAYYDSNRYEYFSASQVFCLFRRDLPGQTRGVSWFAPVLPYLQQLREYTQATVEAAKAGAKVFATVETQTGYALDCVDEHYLEPGSYQYQAYDSFDTPNGKLVHLPVGTTLKGFTPTQPTTAADAYTANLLSQIGYSMGLPRNKATGSSHEYNFASGRLDNQPFEMLIDELQRDMFERSLVDKIFLYFYRLIAPDLFARFESAPSPVDVDWEWLWPKPPLVDAEATARTNAIRVKAGQATLEEIWREFHPFDDWEDVREQILKDREDFPELFGASPEKPNEAGTRFGETSAPPVNPVNPVKTEKLIPKEQ
ncbi:MAG: phage portal protein [Thermoguttaceae bacterium]|nr:phage portal protein [Thermoguttaceae bacterium]